MANVKKGDKLRLLSTYRARGSRLEPGEEVAAGFAAFDRASHDPLLVELHTDETFVALSDSDSGQVYVEASHENQRYACILLPDTFEAA